MGYRDQGRKAQIFSTTTAPPNAPSGGCGPGMSRGPGPSCGSNIAIDVVDHSAPAGRHQGASKGILKGRSAYEIIGEFDRKISTATDIHSLFRIASELTQVQQTMESNGMIRKPKAGDEDVREAVMSTITEPLGALEKIIFSATSALIEDGIDAAIKEGFTKALSEALKVTIEKNFGEFAKALADAYKKRDLKSVAKAGSAAAKAMSKSLTDTDGLLRETIRIMRRNGLIVDKSVEYALRRWLVGKLKDAASLFKSITTLLSSPVVITLKIFFTSSNVVNDQGELYFAFKELGEKLQRKMTKLMPAMPDAPIGNGLLIPQSNDASASIRRAP